MDTSHLFSTALQLQEPWKVGSVYFHDADGGRQELHIMIVLLQCLLGGFGSVFPLVRWSHMFSRRSISSLEPTYSCIYVYISVYMCI